ncbi:hypothetical protein WHR41_01381 [Cladosporium halotolerans]|uniref:Uncharacterized protein n=1 Tax=Cladosporium halotolerans TaxID=1052096 RepID=A0AB34L296_9PEZI
MLLIKAIALLVAATAASPIAEPVPEPATVNPTSVFCAVVTGLVTKAKAQPQATSYCSSYLSIKTSVLTKRIIVPSYTSTTVVTVPTSTVEATEFVYENSITTVGVPPTGTCSQAITERAVNTVPKPACFATYTAAPIISSACKCLSIPVPTSSTVVYSTVPAVSTSTQNVITTTVTRTIVKTSTSTTTNSYFNIRATGAVNALAGLGVFYFGNLGARGIPFDDSQPVSNFKLDTDCSLVLYSNSYPVGTDAWVLDNAYLQFGEGYCNVPGNICDRLKCYVAGDLSMQCIGPEGQSYHSVCRWFRFANDFIWFVRREAACGDDKRIFLSIE